MTARKLNFVLMHPEKKCFYELSKLQSDDIYYLFRPTLSRNAEEQSS